MASIDFATTVILINGNEAEPAFTLPHNNSFRIYDDETSGERIHSRDREGTPFVRLRKTWLVLTTTRKPFDPLVGWVFGSDDELCDLVLDVNSAQGVSGKHFRIDHDWESRSVILTNMSRHGTKLISPSIGFRGKMISGSSTWRIRPDEQTTIEAGGSSITVEVPRRGVCQGEYDENLEAYYREVQEAVPQVGRLGFHGSLIETPLVARGERTQSQYVLQEEIGRGAYGIVYKAFDPSTERVYAVKKLLNEHSPAEINILQKVSHDHIVAFIDVLDGPDSILVLEYMAGGNLSQLTSPTKDEITITINQQLLAISYLHRMDITHRDIKPENVLVQQRRPDLITKLSDFGLSSETAKLVTFCGTDLYCAPEIEESYRKTRPKSADASYTNVVDVWSLGIVYMQYTIGLPPRPKPWNYPQWTRLLQSRMSRHRRKVGPLLPEMLQPDPKKRPSADDCLSQFPSCSSSFPAAMKASKRGRHQLSTIQEGPVSKIQMSAEPRKRARPDQSESKVQPEDEILDLFGSGWLRNSLCVGSQLAGQVEGDEAESDLFESNFCSRGTTLSGQAHLTAETIALRRSIESERDPGYQDVNEATISLGERQEIVRQLLRATREAEEVDQALHQDSTSDTSQFRFSGFL